MSDPFGPLRSIGDESGRSAEEADGWVDDPWDHVEAAVDDDLVEQRRFPRPNKWVVRGVLAVVFAVVVAVASVGWWYLRQVNPSGEATTAVNFAINEDDTLDAVSRRLEVLGVITSARVFRWYVGRNGGIDFVPGYYQVMPRDHMGDIMGELNTPPAQTFVNVTFPEGYTIEQIAARLAEKVPRLDAVTFLQQAAAGVVTSDFGPANPPTGPTALEGLLFPDTYQISGDDSATRVIDRMTSLMERVGRQEGLDESEENVGYSPYEVLVIASMIEREAKVPEDRAKIARVIYNRLRRDMLLQIDATLRYGQPDDLSIAELVQIDSPYNTYTRKGLPATPIANPGRASIRAALNPAPNPPLSDPICKDLKKAQRCEYIYYVIADKEGGHVFAATLAQHEANVEAARAAGLIG
ncbi:MAG: endolytic transglycosylase MltG [Actinomycetota bacterium]